MTASSSSCFHQADASVPEQNSKSVSVPKMIFGPNSRNCIRHLRSSHLHGYSQAMQWFFRHIILPLKLFVSSQAQRVSKLACDTKQANQSMCMSHPIIDVSHCTRQAALACLPFIGVVKKCICGVQQQRRPSCGSHDVQETSDASHLWEMSNRKWGSLASFLSWFRSRAGSLRCSMILYAVFYVVTLVELGRAHLAASSTVRQHLCP